MKHFIALLIYFLLGSTTGINTWHVIGPDKTDIKKISYNKKKKNKTDSVKLLNKNPGNPYITNYNFNLNNQQIWSICQDEHGQMIFAHRQGLTIFDGTRWENIKLPGIPIILKALPDQNLILVGCDNQFGYIKQNSKGLYEFKSLSDENMRPGEITDIIVNETHICIYSDESIYLIDRESLETVDKWFVQDGVKQNGIFQFGEDIYISKTRQGIYKLGEGGKKELIPQSRQFSINQLAFSLKFSETKVLIGTYGNNLYTFDGKNIKEYNCGASNYISESQLVGGINLDEDLFALSTLSGGVVILNKTNGNIENIIDYQNGLPDDEIFATGTDAQGGLWLSHGFGISRINYDLPVKDFNNYPGMEGKLIDYIEFENTGYIATTEGVFYLDTISNVKEFEVFIKKTPLKSIEKNYVVPDIKSEKENSDKNEILNEPERKKSIFQRWKEKREERKKKKAEVKGTTDNETELKNETEPETSNTEITASEENKADTESPTVKKNKNITKRIKYKKQTVRISSLSYIYKKVKNISGKCKQLIKYKNSILVASNNGLYEIKDNVARKIIKNVYVNTITPSKTEGLFYIGTNKGITAIKEYKKGWKEYKKIEPDEFSDDVLSIAEDENNDLWIGSDAIIYHFNVENNYKTTSFDIYDFGKEYIDKFMVRNIGDKIYFLSPMQIYTYNKEQNQIELTNELLSNKLAFVKYITSQVEVNWIKEDDKWKCISSVYNPTDEQIALLNLFENIQNIRIDEEKNIWVVDGNNKLYKILPKDISESYLGNFKVYLRNIQSDLGNFIDLKKIVIDPEVNSLTFKISAPYYLKSEGLRYQYFIKGAMNGWTDWKQTNDFDFFLYPGVYTVQIRARNIFGNICVSDTYRINVKSPIWMKTWFIATGLATVIILISALLFMLQKKKERKLQRNNKILEAKVEERTQKIKKQKEQIELKNREITDSLNYASQIQSAILPPIKVIDDSVSEAFVINIPKDIVSGDYYWANRINGQLVVTAADCTGHGVPGAFLSLLGVTFLNEITNKMDHLVANQIVEQLRDRVISSLHQEGYTKKRLDGIDLSLIVLDLNTHEMQFAGANNPLYVIRNGELTEIKGDRMPVGIHSHRDKPFTNHRIEANKGDIVYLFSDGFIDQFGGDYGRKFLSRNFKFLLTEISSLPLSEQSNILTEILENWKGNRDQLDDILIVGFRI